jgi:hypothetical protein
MVSVIGIACAALSMTVPLAVTGLPCVAAAPV